MSINSNITGIILSGGKSIRMGENKPFIKIEGIPIINRIFGLFKGLFEEVIIVTNQKELYKTFDAKIFNDIFPNSGVAGGLYSGLFFSSFRYSFCVASDMPFLKESVIEYLIKSLEDCDVVVPRTKDGLQPLHAIYSKNCLEPIREIIENKSYRVIDFYEKVKTKIIDEVEFISLDPQRESFLNINTPEELIKIKEKASFLK